MYTNPARITYLLYLPGCITADNQRCCVLRQKWVTYSAGYNTTLAMIADNAINGPYSLAVHNGKVRTPLILNPGSDMQYC